MHLFNNNQKAPAWPNEITDQDHRGRSPPPAPGGKRGAGKRPKAAAGKASIQPVIPGQGIVQLIAAAQLHKGFG